MLKDLQLLVSIQSAIYKGLLKSEIKMKHSAHTQWDHTAKQQVLTTLVYLVNNFRLDDKDKFWADVPNSAYTEAFKPYFDAVFGVPPNHLFKRALTDSNNIRYNKMVEFRKFCQQLCPKAHAALSTTELLYMIGPIIKREAAGDAYNLPPGQTSTSWTPSATNSPTPAVSTISGKSPFNTKLSTPTPTPTPTPTTTTTTTRNNKQFKAFVSSDHDSYSIIVSAHAGLNDAFEATRPELFTDYTHFEQLFQDIVLCHKLGFAHCDVRRPNIVYHSTTTLGQKMSLVDREYYHSRYTRLSESTATTATATATIAKEEKLAIVDMNTKKVYKHIRTYKYFDFFSRSVMQVCLMEPEPDPRPPRVPDFRWDWDSFRRLDFYNLVRSFFEEHIDKWDNEELEDFKPLDELCETDEKFPKFITITAAFLDAVVPDKRNQQPPSPPQQQQREAETETETEAEAEKQQQSSQQQSLDPETTTTPLPLPDAQQRQQQQHCNCHFCRCDEASPNSNTPIQQQQQQQPEPLSSPPPSPSPSQKFFLSSALSLISSDWNGVNNHDHKQAKRSSPNPSPHHHHHHHQCNCNHHPLTFLHHTHFNTPRISNATAVHQIKLQHPFFAS
jgi:hypothetical protein